MQPFHISDVRLFQMTRPFTQWVRRKALDGHEEALDAARDEARHMNKRLFEELNDECIDVVVDTFVVHSKTTKKDYQYRALKTDEVPTKTAPKTSLMITFR